MTSKEEREALASRIVERIKQQTRQMQGSYGVEIKIEGVPCTFIHYDDKEAQRRIDELDPSEDQSISAPQIQFLFEEGWFFSYPERGGSSITFETLEDAVDDLLEEIIGYEESEEDDFD